MTAEHVALCRCTNEQLEDGETCAMPGCPNLPMENRLTLVQERHPDWELFIEEEFGEGGKVLKQFIVDGTTDETLHVETRPELFIPIRRERTKFERSWNV